MSALRDRRIAYSQNFLHSPKLVDRLLDRSGIAADDLVIEVGPGRGVITARLARRCRQVLAVEKDPLLVEELRGQFAQAENVALFAADFLTFPLPLTSYKVFANIPFNITAAIVGKLTSGSSPPVDAYLGMQREAADRFLGAPRETLVAVLLKPWFEPSVVHHFRSGDFTPAPAVEVVMLRLRRRDEPLVPVAEATLFGDLVTYAFTAWQPTVAGALTRAFPKRKVAEIARASGVCLERSPGALPFSDWLRLASAFHVIAGANVAPVQGARERLEQQQTGLQKVHRTRTSRQLLPAAARGRGGGKRS